MLTVQHDKSISRASATKLFARAKTDLETDLAIIDRFLKTNDPNTIPMLDTLEEASSILASTFNKKKHH
jgi:hypothetical protein